MTTNNKSSILVDELLPEFLDTEGPKFKAFMRAYYEWLETSNQVTDRSKNLTLTSITLTKNLSNTFNEKY